MLGHGKPGQEGSALALTASLVAVGVCSFPLRNNIESVTEKVFTASVTVNYAS